MRAVLDHRDKTDLGKGCFTMRSARPTKGCIVDRFIGNIQRAAIKAHKAPVPVPSPLAPGACHRFNQRIVQVFHNRRSQPTAGLRNTRLARNADRRAKVQPLQTFQQTPQHLTRRRLHVKAQRQHIIDHDVSRKITLPLARFPRRCQRFVNTRNRERSSQYSETEKIRKATA